MTYPGPPYNTFAASGHAPQQPSGQRQSGDRDSSQVPGQVPIGGPIDGHISGQTHGQFPGQAPSVFSHSSGHIPGYESGYGTDHAAMTVPSRAAAFPERAAPTVERPYHSKRPHKKSRAGCHNCKIRKVKCNEAWPRCRTCAQRDEACIYPRATQTQTSAPKSTAARRSAPIASSHRSALQCSPSSSSGVGSVVQRHVPLPSTSRPSYPREELVEEVTHHSHPVGLERVGWQGSGASSRHSNALEIIQEPMFRPAQLDETDMKLLWFYTSKAFDAFSSKANRQPQIDEALQVVIPRHAFAHRFLMDCMLALSSLELRSLNQPATVHRVLKYRAQALTGYRQAIENATPDKYPALLACSLLLCALSSEMFRDPECRPLYILDWMIVWRGIGLIVNLIDPEALHSSGLSILFARAPINMEVSARFVPNNLLLLLSLIGPKSPDYKYVDTYVETLKLLGSLYRDIHAGLGKILLLRIITWFTFLPTAFVEAARKHRPLALIIVGHYLIFIKICSHMWWMRGIADKEIRDIKNVLGREWLPFFSAPIAALSITDLLDLRKLLLREEDWAPDPFYDAVRNSLVVDRATAGGNRSQVVFTGSWMAQESGKQTWSDKDYLDLAKLRFNEEELETQLAIGPAKNTPTSSTVSSVAATQGHTSQPDTSQTLGPPESD